MSHLTSEEITLLKEKAKEVRIDILKMITKANSGHTGGSLSVADLLTLLYFKEMNINPEDPHWQEGTGLSFPKDTGLLLCMLAFLKEDISRKKNLKVSVRPVICFRDILI